MLLILLLQRARAMLRRHFQNNLDTRVRSRGSKMTPLTFHGHHRRLFPQWHYNYFPRVNFNLETWQIESRLENMHSVTVRLNTVIFFALTVLLFSAIFCALRLEFVIVDFSFVYFASSTYLHSGVPVVNSLKVNKLQSL